MSTNLQGSQKSALNLGARGLVSLANHCLQKKALLQARRIEEAKLTIFLANYHSVTPLLMPWLQPVFHL